jgi:hypothetical protein
MTLGDELKDLFGRDNLVYASPSRLDNLGIPEETKDFILKTGFPHVISYLRFSLDFEALSKDIQIGEQVSKFEKNIGPLFTIGCKGATQLIGRFVQLQQIGLDNNASVTDIRRKIELLGLDDAVFSSEVTSAWRICLDSGCNNEIKCVNPTDLSIYFFNSSIEHLAASLVAYERSFLYEQSFAVELKDFEKKLQRIDPKALESKGNVWIMLIEQLLLDEDEY